MTGHEVPAETAEFYRSRGWWTHLSVSQMVRQRSDEHPENVAYVDDEKAWTWAEYDRLGDGVFALLRSVDLERGDRVGVHLPDSALLHAAYLGCERAGAIAVGVPIRAGRREVAQLLSRTGARVLIVLKERGEGPSPADLASHGALVERVLAIDGTSILQDALPGSRSTHGVPGAISPGCDGITPHEPWLLNFTSGTTGLPKAVVQTQNRWFYLAQAASGGAGIDSNDVVLSAIPGPYGFGLWTAHFVPAMHGCSCCISGRFSPEDTLRIIQRERVTVLACVTTQLIMMLEHPLALETNFSSLRVTFTGGEKVPYDKASRWEDLTGSRVLQFYGSNEAGPFSCTRFDDDRDTRLTTAGTVVDGVEWKLLDERAEAGERGTQRVGQATLKSPGAHGGYWDDPAANSDLYTHDGFMIMPDVVAIDGRDRVRIVGRKSDIIIRGGKNISAAVIEHEVSAHPGVRMAVAVPVDDPIYGERIGVAIVLRDSRRAFNLEQLTDFLATRGVSKEYWPERLRLVNEIPMSLGAKADKHQIRQWFQML